MRPPTAMLPQNTLIMTDCATSPAGPLATTMAVVNSVAELPKARPHAADAR